MADHLTAADAARLLASAKVQVDARGDVVFRVETAIARSDLAAAAPDLARALIDVTRERDTLADALREMVYDRCEYAGDIPTCTACGGHPPRWPLGAAVVHKPDCIAIRLKRMPRHDP